MHVTVRRGDTTSRVELRLTRRFDYQGGHKTLDAIRLGSQRIRGLVRSAPGGG
jgi:hypothetical protein